jgi:cell wall-associated NlpC family hydrolase
VPTFDVTSRHDLTRSRNKWRGRFRRLRKLTARAKAMVAKRNRQLKALPKGTQRQKVCAFLLAHVGWHEDTGRPNRAAWLDKWAADIGSWMRGAPWCGLTVWEACRHAGLALDKTTVSTVAIRSMAQRGTGGFRTWHDATSGYQPQPGDVAIYGTAGTGPVHTGIYVGGGRMVEGNTSPGSGGSQANGGGIYIRSLAERRGWLLGWAIPKYVS